MKQAEADRIEEMAAKILRCGLESLPRKSRTDEQRGTNCCRGRVSPMLELSEDNPRSRNNEIGFREHVVIDTL